eukprot:TRINITY_DN16673_c0_g1_i1.p1 TRINITY_DN16673_c0_g1~~TRINITY_DN16673_c0_g1_i1.p1  ORF type:complete len:212 (-),score=43.40 TRINITY_DN16673_c0_g1_i1:199-834(-)
MEDKTASLFLQLQSKIQDLNEGNKNGNVRYKIVENSEELEQSLDQDDNISHSEENNNNEEIIGYNNIVFHSVDPGKVKKKRNLPDQARKVLYAWLYRYKHNPYPTKREKLLFCKQLNLTLTQVNTFFRNGRNRFLKKSLSLSQSKILMDKSKYNIINPSNTDWIRQISECNNDNENKIIQQPADSGVKHFIINKNNNNNGNNNNNNNEDED